MNHKRFLDVAESSHKQWTPWDKPPLSSGAYIKSSKIIVATMKSKDKIVFEESEMWYFDFNITGIVKANPIKIRNSKPDEPCACDFNMFKITIRPNTVNGHPIYDIHPKTPSFLGRDIFCFYWMPPFCAPLRQLPCLPFPWKESCDSYYFSFVCS